MTVYSIFTPSAFLTADQNLLAEASLGGTPKVTDMTLMVEPSPGVRGIEVTGGMVGNYSARSARQGLWLSGCGEIETFPTRGQQFRHSRLLGLGGLRSPTCIDS